MPTETVFYGFVAVDVVGKIKIGDIFCQISRICKIDDFGILLFEFLGVSLD